MRHQRAALRGRAHRVRRCLLRSANQRHALRILRQHLCGWCIVLRRRGCTDDFPCTGGKKPCALACVDVLNDRATCGACRNACEADTCQGGVCIGIIQASEACAIFGLTSCGGVCFDTENDVLNCGACGLECAYGETCASGNFQSSCAAGLSYCNGVCVDTASDPSHCGFCNIACGGFDTCVSGACVSTLQEQLDSVLTCAAKGLTDCGGVCVDLLNDDVNCGACGYACYPGLCNNGIGTCSICDPTNEPVPIRTALRLSEARRCRVRRRWGRRH